MKTGKQFVKFGIVGVVNTAVQFVVFYLLFRQLHLPMMVSSGLGYMAGVINSYLINRVWTFEVKEKKKAGEFMRFVAVNIVSMGVNLGALKLLVVYGGLLPELAQAFAIAASLVVNFAGNKWWTFRDDGGVEFRRAQLMQKEQPGLKRGVVIFLGLAFLGSFILKLMNAKVGAPFVTIDDNTTFEGGFMVWFGNAPPQRMYLESWLCGVTSLATYVWQAVRGVSAGGLGSNLVADAYQDYYGDPNPYVHVYRVFVVFLDMITAWMVYRVGRLVLGRMWQGWAAALAAVLYLFSFNTVWCDVVARPDVLVAVFSTTGLYFYYKSDFGENRNYFWLAAIFLGLGGGLKLHACLFVVFCAFDLLRIHGWRKGLSLAFPLVVISVIFFALASGMTLFDPLRYLKLRMMNAKDDESPWIQWGDQLYVLIKGSGWLTVPFLFLGAWHSLIRKADGAKDRMSSVIFISLLWIVVFASIRQLRAYWMLPALPLFYIAFIYGLSKLKNSKIRIALVVLVLGVMITESVRETRSFQLVEYGGLQSWIRENVQSDEPMFIYGYEAVELPKTNSCIDKKRSGILRSLDHDVASGETHVMRHLKNWEEESTLVLYDMLAGRKDEGFEYYSIFGTPWDRYEGIIELDDMQYILVQDGFDVVEYGMAPAYLDDHFEFLVDLVGPGGGGSGLGYQVYGRRVKR
jgi:putative flippase GtrA